MTEEDQCPSGNAVCSPAAVRLRLDFLERASERLPAVFQGIDDKLAALKDMAIEDRTERRGLGSAITRAFGEIKENREDISKIREEMPMARLTSRGAIGLVGLVFTVLVSAAVAGAVAESFRRPPGAPADYQRQR